jgi:DedD protein
MDQQLKERLVGAVVLACTAVILIPMVLSGRGERPVVEDEPAVAPLPADEAGFSSRIVPLQQSGGSAPARQTAPPPPAPTRREPVPPPSPPRAADLAERPDAAKPAQPAERIVPGRGGWVVQLGSFSNARNAGALRDRLRASGYSAFVQSTTSGGAKVTRVFVGPEPSREAAERVVARLLDETRLKGIVVRNPSR